MSAYRDFSSYAEALLLAFCQNLDDRIERASFDDAAVAHFWSEIREDAKQSLNLLQVQYVPRLEVADAQALGAFKDALWRSERALDAASSDEFQYADWLLRASEVLEKRLAERSLLAELPQAQEPRPAEEPGIHVPVDDGEWSSSEQESGWDESLGPPGRRFRMTAISDPGTRRGLHLAHARDYFHASPDQPRTRPISQVVL